MSLIELAEYLKNASEACRVMGVSRQHFYDIKKVYAEGGMAALQEKSRRKPNLKNRVAPEIEAAVVRIDRNGTICLFQTFCLRLQEQNSIR